MPPPRPPEEHVSDHPAPSAAPAITWAAQVRGAYKIYGRDEAEVRALDGVTVGFEPARFTAIMGPSGSGKSTLMQCAAGLDRLDAGVAYIGDVDITRLTEKQLTLLRRDKVGFVFQQYNLLATLTAEENITFPLDLAGRKPDRAWMDQVVSTVGLGDRLDHKPSELSGGQQ
jgi:putative ABC transport system ATP-binding protein